MQIRHKINLWITSLGLLVNLVLASIILFEAIELPYEALDEELEIEIREDLKPPDGIITGQDFNPQFFSDQLDFDELYWIKVLDKDQNTVFVSKLARHIEIPFHDKQEAYNCDIVVPEYSAFYNQKHGGNINEAVHEKNRKGDFKKIIIPFRINRFKIDMGETFFYIQIARSIEDIEAEINELIHIVVMGFVVAAAILMIFSYLLTNKILQPIIEINALAREISASDMSRRIPLGKNKDELYHLSKSLNSMFDRLQQSFAGQKQLVADAAHELKSPITMLLLFIERSMERQDLPLEYSKGLIIQANILRRMSRLVKNLLDISILELKDSLSIETFDLDAMMAKILDDFEMVFEASGIQIKKKIPPGYRMKGDREKIQRLLINLVDNAAKYNCDKGKIKIACTPENHCLRISVWNTGPGIPEQDLKNVLKKFYRVEKSRSQRHGGSGLGLTIVNKIAQLHGGHVIMESEADTWCRATVILPL